MHFDLGADFNYLVRPHVSLTHETLNLEITSNLGLLPVGHDWTNVCSAG